MWKFERERLSTLREMRGITQTEAAALLGVTHRQQWNDWERGKNTPSVATLIEISNKFDCNPGFFFVLNVESNQQ